MISRKPLLIGGVASGLAAGAILGLTSGCRRSTASPSDPAALIAALKEAEGQVRTGRLSLHTIRRQGELPQVGNEPSEVWETVGKLPVAERREERLHFSGSDWMREVTLSDPSGKRRAQIRVGMTDKIARILQETGSGSAVRRAGIVTTKLEREAADWLLTDRGTSLLEGVTWTRSSRLETQWVLEGQQGDGTIRVTLNTSPRPAIQALRREQALDTGQGAVLRIQELRATYDESGKGLAPRAVEDLIYTAGAVSVAALARYEVREADFNASVEPEELRVSFPPGTPVTDQRVDPPVKYAATTKDPTEADLLAIQEKQGIAVARTGRPAPGWELKTLDGKVARLSDNRGKVVLLTWFASW